VSRLILFFELVSFSVCNTFSDLRYFTYGFDVYISKTSIRLYPTGIRLLVGALAGQQFIPDLMQNGYKRSRYPFRCDRRPQELREMEDGNKRYLSLIDERIV
jgi:hypothetical protein